MRAASTFTCFALAALVSAFAGSLAAAEGDAKLAVARGLKHLAQTQGSDGRWEGDGGAYRVAVTCLAGMAFLMDGNTPVQGPYAVNVDRAARYVMAQYQSNGLIGIPQSDNRYLYGHGFAMLFLSQILGEERDPRQREKLVQMLTKAVEFSGRAQTVDGGWGYEAARDGAGFDEGSVTATQMQGLRSCRNAGIPVPKEIISKAIRYIERCTDSSGGVRYSLKTNGGVRPPLSPAALACLFSAGEHDNPLASKLRKASDASFRPGMEAVGLFGHWHYAHYYYSQVLYRSDEAKWKAYREAVYPRLVKEQDANGSWTQEFVGPAYTTSLNLAILQLDNASLPVYQR